MTTGRINQVTLFCTPSLLTLNPPPKKRHVLRRTQLENQSKGLTYRPGSTTTLTPSLRTQWLSPNNDNHHTHNQDMTTTVETGWIREELSKSLFCCERQRLFGTSVTFHYVDHHTKLQRERSEELTRGFLKVDVWCK